MITPTFVSTSALSSETRSSIARIQARLVDAQKELGTLRHADVGLTLGATTGISISMRQDMTQIQSIKDTNSIVLTRMRGSQAALQSLADKAQSVMTALTGAQSASLMPETIVQEAKAGLQTVQDQLNASLDGQYLFSGINSDVKPMEDYFANPPPASAQSVNAAFFAKFGMNPTDPGVNSISDTDMESFLNNEFADLFSDANWSANWSAASDRPVNSRISRTETANTSTTANEMAFRQMTQAFTMVSGLGFANLNSGAQQAIVKAATTMLGNGISGVTKIQSFLGVTQQRVADSNDQVDTQLAFLERSIGDLESVDPAEITTTISNLTTQLEAAYSITNRLNNLSLMNFLK